MTSDIDDLIESTYYLCANAGIQPSEVDRLTPYEMRKYINLIRTKKSAENEHNSSLAGALLGALGFTKKKS